MLTVIFVFARRYFVSLKSCPLLFLLLAEVVFFFCEVITKLILGTCAWAWAWTHDGEKVFSVNLKFLYLRSTNNLESDSTVLASLHTETDWGKKRTPRTTCRERPETFFLWMFLLRQWLCHNENWNRSSAHSGVTFTWSRHTTLWKGCVAWPVQIKRGCTLRAVPPFRRRPSRE